MRKFIIIFSTFFTSFLSLACDRNQAQSLADDLSISRRDSCKILDQTFLNLKAEVKENQKVDIPNFGTFQQGKGISFKGYNSLNRVLRKQEELEVICHERIVSKVMLGINENYEMSCLYFEKVVNMLVKRLQKFPKRALVVPKFGSFRLNSQTTLNIGKTPKWFPQDIHVLFHSWP